MVAPREDKQLTYKNCLCGAPWENLSKEKGGIICSKYASEGEEGRGKRMK